MPSWCWKISRPISNAVRSRKEAAIYATNEVWLSVIATTLVTVAVFLPLTLVSGLSGIMFRELGWIVSIVVSVSTAAAISLTPMLSAYILHKEGGEHDYKGLGILYKPIDRALTWLDGAYARMLATVLNHRRWTLGAVLVVFCASLLLLSRVPFEFFPPADNGRIAATVRLQQNVSVEYTARIAREIDSVIRTKYPEVLLISASAGASSGDDAFSAMQTTGRTSSTTICVCRVRASAIVRSTRFPTCCVRISTGFPKSTATRSRRAAIRAR